MLNLQKLILTNFAQFKNKTIELNSEAVLIIGPNGSGKSNVIEAIYFTITGELRNKSKAELLHEDEDGKASKGSAELHFSYRGINGTISRNLHNAGCTLTYGDTSLTKASDVNSFLAALTGVTKRTFSKYCCVAQGETEAIVSDNDSVRADVLGELFGSQHCRGLYELLGKEESAVEVSDYSTVLYDSERAIEELKQAITNLQDELNKNNTQLTTLGNKSALDNIVSAYVSGVAARSTLDQLNKELASLQNNKLEYEATLSGLRQEHTKQLKVCDVLRPKVESARKALNSFAKLNYCKTESERLIANRLEIERELLNIQAQQAELVEPSRTLTEEQLNQARDKFIKAYAAVETLEKCASDGKYICPTCLREFPDGESCLQELKREFTAANSEFQIVKTKYEQESKAFEAFTSEKVKLDNLEYERVSSLRNIAHELLNKETVIGGLENICSKFTQEECGELVTLFSNVSEEVRVLDSKVESNKDILNRTNTRLSEINKRISDLQLLCVNVPTEEVYSSAKIKLEEISTLINEISKLSGNIQGLESSLATAIDNNKKLKLAAAKSDKLRNFKNLLSAARDVMHRDNLPRVRAVKFMSIINEQLSFFLQLFDSEFSAELTDNYSFMCPFSNGKVLSAQALSGGEKIRLSLAFRFAVNSLFAKNLGLLILDEPTVYLDNTNVGLLGELFKHIRKTAKNTNTQIIVVTHEPELQGFFDSVVDLSDD